MASVFDFMHGNVPKVETSKALILTGLQNDFCSRDGKLYAGVDHSFVDQIERLVTAFRPHGHVIWIRSEYDPALPADEQGSDVYNVCLPHSEQLNREDRPQHVDEELFLSASAYGGPATIKNTTGALYADQFKHLMQPGDQHIIKHNYSAFHLTDLLMTLRCRLATHIFVCGALSNISAHATALDAASNGMQITMIKDCLAFRSQERHDSALASLSKDAAARNVTSEQALEWLANPQLVLFDDDELTADEDEFEDYDDFDKYSEDDFSATALIYNTNGGDQPYESVLKTNGGLASTHDGFAGSTAAESAKSLPDELPSVPTTKSTLDGTSGRIAELQDDTALQALLPSSVDPGSEYAQDHIPPQIALPLRAMSKRSRRPSVGESSEGELHRNQRQRFCSLSQGLRAQSSTPTLSHDASRGSLQADRRKAVEARRSCQDLLSHAAAQTVEASIVERTSALGISHSTTQIEAHQAPMLVHAESASSPEGAGVNHDSCKSIQELSVPNLITHRLIEPLFGQGRDTESDGSSIVYGLLDESASECVFETLKTEVQWVRMLHQTGEVPRLVCCQGMTNHDGSTPVYRHPSDKTILITPWTAKVEEVRKIAEEVVGHELNHALIQLYRNGHDFISEHSDKTLDIVPGSNIVNVSFGAERTMRLRSKRQPGDSEAKTRTTYRVRMPHNSMLIMSLRTNAEYLHGIKADKRREVELSEAESAYEGQRISITFRQIGTFLASDGRIWGEGATGKSPDSAKPIDKDPGSIRRLIDAFGAENQCSTLHREGIYGEGWDVLHLLP